MVRKTFESVRRNPAFPAPTALSRLLRAGRTSSAEDLTAIIDTDPRATAVVLGLHQLIVGGSSINDSLRDAVSGLGPNAVRSLVLMVQMFDATRGIRCTGFSHDELLAEAAARGAAALIISRRLAGTACADAVVCGMISEIGRVILASVYPDAYGYTLNLIHMTSRTRTAEIEREVFDIDHHQLAAEVIGDWGLSVTLRDAVLMHGRSHRQATCNRNGPSLTAVLELAAAIAHIIALGSTTAREVDEMTRHCVDLGLGADALATVFDSVLITWPATASLLDAPTHEVSRWDQLAVSD